MAQWCDSCGQLLPDGDSAADAVWIGAVGEEHEHSFRKPAGSKTTGRDKKLLAAVAAAVVVWGLFVGIGKVVTPADTIDEQAAAEIEEARIERLTQAALEEAEAEREAALEEARIAESETDYDAADAAPGFPDADTAIDPDAPIDDGRAEPVVDSNNLGARTTPSVQVERLQRQLERRGTPAFVAYRSDNGVVLIDMVNGAAVVSADSDVLEFVRAGAHVLRAGAVTYAIDPETLVVSQVGQDSSVVVSDARDSNTYFVDAKGLSGQASIVEVVANGEYTFHRMPAGGFQLQPVDGLGLLAVPQGPTGETRIAEADEFTTLSENRVLTGTAHALLEQVCDTDATCSLMITNLDSGEQTPVPASFVRFGDQYVLAPDGGSLLRYSSGGFAELFVSRGAYGEATDSIAWVTGAGMSAAAWGPNSDFVAWLDVIGHPKLKVMLPEERDWLSVDLSDIGAPPPSGPELVAFIPDIDAGLTPPTPIESE